MFEKIKSKICDLEEKERRKIYEAAFSFQVVEPLKYSELMEIIQYIPLRDDIKIHLSTENDEVFTFDRKSRSGDYEHFIRDLFDDEIVFAKLEINKKFQNKHFSIYYFEKFVEDMMGLSTEEVMKIFAAFLKESDEYIVFDMFDNPNVFYTKTMFFVPLENNEISMEFDREQRLQDCREVSYFYNQDIYELLPDDFKIIVDYKDNPFTSMFQKIETILSLCMVTSNSSIWQDKLKVQIMGQRSVDYTFKLNEIEGTPVLYKVYDWIYAGGNAMDKAILARNIICLHCKYEPLLKMDLKVLASIQSNYNLYLKENVSQYLELKNKVAEFISEIISKTGEYATEMLDKFKTNLMAIFVFLFTVVIANIVSDQPLDNIFTRDITMILELVLAGSLVYLIISYLQSKYQMSRVYDSYDKLKESYRNILTDDDIRECFHNDQLITDMKDAIRKSQIRYSMLWFGFLILLLVCLEKVSESPIIISLFNDIIEMMEKIYNNTH